MANVIAVVALILVIGGASWYIYRAKKNGQKCIGCPDSKTCSGHCSGCTCGCNDK